ncbi:hypothetical protein BOX15_Mlig030406g2, partial [Macrostomum lignano]
QAQGVKLNCPKSWHFPTALHCHLLTVKRLKRTGAVYLSMSSTLAEIHSDFDWSDYLHQLGSAAGQAAPASCFKQAAVPPVNEFQPGQRVEAKDPRNLDNTCIATVIECLGPRLRLRLDGSDDRNDFYRLADSEDLFHHPSGRFIVPPLGYAKSMSTWPAFLARIEAAGNFAPAACFKRPPPAPARNTFVPGQRLEAVDRKHPQLVCPATVRDIRQDRLHVSFDGWRGAFDYWCRYDSRDIFPVGWCSAAGYPVQPPGSSVSYSPTTTTNNTTSTSSSSRFQSNRNKVKQASGASGVSTASPSAFSDRSSSAGSPPPPPPPPQPALQSNPDNDDVSIVDEADQSVAVSAHAPVLVTESEEDAAEPDSDMSGWSNAEVSRGLRYWRLSELAPLLQRHSVDGLALQSLTADTLVLGMGARVGPALKLVSRVERARRRQNLLRCLRALHRNS